MAGINGINTADTTVQPKPSEPKKRTEEVPNSVVADDNPPQGGLHVSAGAGAFYNEDVLSGDKPYGTGLSHVQASVGYTRGNSDVTVTATTGGNYNAINARYTQNLYTSNNGQWSFGVGANADYNILSTNTAGQTRNDNGNFTEIYKPNTFVGGVFGSATFRPSENLSFTGSVGLNGATNGKSETRVIDYDEVTVGGDTALLGSAQIEAKYKFGSMYQANLSAGINTNGTGFIGVGAGISLGGR